MRLVKVDSIPTVKHGQNNKLLDLIDDFMESGFEYAEVTFADGEYKSAYSLATSVKHVINRTKRRCACAVRDKKVYLCRLDSNK